MTSPILELERAIAGAAFAIAPEREQELAHDERTRQFTLVFSNRPGFDIGVVVDTQVATLPIPALEYLWCCAHFFYVLHQEYVSAQQSARVAFDFEKSPRAADALVLLNWSMRNMEQPGTQGCWPDDAPRPTRNPAYASDVQVANELFLCAIAWLIHHELAHVRLNHKPLHPSPRNERERDADLAATDWVTASASMALAAQKRQLGIVTAIMAMQLLDRPAPETSAETHPATVERLDYCLDRAGAGNDSVVCAFSAVALQFHLSQFDIQAELDGSSIREVLAGFQVAFMRHGRA